MASPCEIRLRRVGFISFNLMRSIEFHNPYSGLFHRERKRTISLYLAAQTVTERATRRILKREERILQFIHNAVRDIFALCGIIMPVLRAIQRPKERMEYGAGQKVSRYGAGRQAAF